jgi:hypothetical protein
VDGIEHHVRALAKLLGIPSDAQIMMRSRCRLLQQR